MPNDRNEWAQRIPEFLVEAETLLAKTEECLSHLQLISNDKDAIDCMLSTLLKLANKADALALAAVPNFPTHTRLAQSCAESMDLHDEALNALKDCLTLIAWQLELIDQKTGQLSLDESEQTTLIEAFAFRLDKVSFSHRLTPTFTIISYAEQT
jgi:lipid II:glycine glycyltransferase (peptidoglycan interpeptide bridge formation enzyme)